MFSHIILSLLLNIMLFSGWGEKYEHADDNIDGIRKE